jgi:hypothetical protein
MPDGMARERTRNAIHGYRNVFLIQRIKDSAGVVQMMIAKSGTTVLAVIHPIGGVRCFACVITKARREHCKQRVRSATDVRHVSKRRIASGIEITIFRIGLRTSRNA